MPTQNTIYPIIFSEVFPINTKKLPKLFGYTLDIQGDELNTTGYQLAYRLRSIIRAHWIWVPTDKKLVSEVFVTEEKLTETIEEIRNKVKDSAKNLTNYNMLFPNLHGIIPDSNFQESPIIISNFVAEGLVQHKTVRKNIELSLEPYFASIQDINIIKIYKIYGCVLQGLPCISISVYSEMHHKDDLATFIKNHDNSPESAKDLWVVDKNSDLRGEISCSMGKLSHHRNRLLALGGNEKTLEIIKNASDDSEVVKVMKKNTRSYDYIAEALNISVRIGDLHRYQTDSKKVFAHMRISPSTRYEMVEKIATILAQQGWIINSPVAPHVRTGIFFTQKDVLPTDEIRFGNNYICPFDDKQILENLRKYGLYRRVPDKKIINIAIITRLSFKNTNANMPTPVCSFLCELRKELQSLGFDLKSTGTLGFWDGSRFEIEQVLNRLSEKNFDIILAILPDEIIRMDDESFDEKDTYSHLKIVATHNNYRSQVVTESTITGKDSRGNPKYRWALGNIILGILAKIGNIPYILAKPLDFTDCIVGLDIGRKKKSRNAGTINAVATVRIYQNTGEFLKYSINDSIIEGETIPKNILQSLFPIKEFQNKRVIIHRDGLFRGDEKTDLQNWAEQIGSTFYLVEVTKSGCPRIYRSPNGEDILRPDKGDGFYFSEQEAILVSSLPPFQESTPNPLRIKTDGKLHIQHAIQSVLALTMLHYGSLHQPRLPVTLHYSDKIAGMVLDGIKPSKMEGSALFWL